MNLHYCIAKVKESISRKKHGCSQIKNKVKFKNSRKEWLLNVIKITKHPRYFYYDRRPLVSTLKTKICLFLKKMPNATSRMLCLGTTTARVHSRGNVSLTASPCRRVVNVPSAVSDLKLVPLLENSHKARPRTKTLAASLTKVTSPKTWFQVLLKQGEKRFHCREWAVSGRWCTDCEASPGI